MFNHISYNVECFHTMTKLNSLADGEVRFFCNSVGINIYVPENCFKDDVY